MYLDCRQSYEVQVDIGVEGSGTMSSNYLDLKNPFFRYSGQPVQSPPGSHMQSPTDIFWNNVSSAMSMNTGMAHQVTPVLQAVSPAHGIAASEPVRGLNYSVNSIMGGTSFMSSAPASVSMSDSQHESQVMMDSSGFLWTNQMAAAAMATSLPYMGQTHTSLSNGSGTMVAHPAFAPQFPESESRRSLQSRCTRCMSPQQK